MIIIYAGIFRSGTPHSVVVNLAKKYNFEARQYYMKEYDIKVCEYPVKENEIPAYKGRGMRRGKFSEYVLELNEKILHVSDNNLPRRLTELEKMLNVTHELSKFKHIITHCERENLPKTKKCTKCKRVLFLQTSFYPSKRTNHKYGYQSYCKQCCKEYYRKRQNDSKNSN